ncbi:hypothetical protein GDO86_006153 [Hymenochirus boettgeri]|uniref:Uncharacterized protein n=1 Tax=Hymenochirus boettgeri TaxID=247094 RepID=A0A8T2JCF8_9PIPI|nr:hypothetical protein GDO86_006153 [Hymenochirus boettgeri]
MENPGSAHLPPSEEHLDTKENTDTPFSGISVSDNLQTTLRTNPPMLQQDDKEDMTLQQSGEQQLGDSGERQDEEQYLDEAEKDKERYTKELQQYQNTDAYRSYSRKAQSRQKGRQQRQEGVRGVPSNTEKESLLKERPIFDIPIFTEEFLNHSKAREAELRQLRKTNMEFEERNAALQKHVESMRSAVQRLETDLSQEQGRNSLIQQHLQNVRQALTHCLRAVPIPGTTETPSMETIDSYMSRLQSAVLTHPKESEAIISGVREVLSQLEG